MDVREKGLGRPPSAPGTRARELRDRFVTVRVSALEHNLLREAAACSGMTLSDYVREKLFEEGVADG